LNDATTKLDQAVREPNMNIRIELEDYCYSMEVELENSVNSAENGNVSSTATTDPVVTEGDVGMKENLEDISDIKNEKIVVNGRPLGNVKDDKTLTGDQSDSVFNGYEIVHSNQ
jgi:hypothetical protein